MHARGRFVLLALMTFALTAPSARAETGFSWSHPRLVDRATPHGHWQAFTSVVCPSASLCLALTDNQVLTSTDPAGGPGTWTAAALPFGEAPSAISCPSVSLCVATDPDGSVLTSTNPAGGTATWQRVQIEPASANPYVTVLSGLSCPTTTLCAARDSSGHILTSTNPAGGASTWKTTAVSGASFEAGMYCPTQSLCLSTQGTQLEVSTDPTGGSAAWKVFTVTPTQLQGIACPSSTLCVAVDGGGRVLSSTDPSGGSGAWTAVPVEPIASGILGDISCPSVSLCVSSSDSGDVISSTDPTGPASAWHHVNLGVGGLRLSCPDSSTCLGFNESGLVLGTHDPTGGASAWSAPAVLDQPLRCGPMCVPPLQQVACPSASLCVMVDWYGRLYASSAPAAGAGAWKSVLALGANAITNLDCPTKSLCVGADDAHRLLTTRDPGGSSNWHVFPHESGLPPVTTSLSCASAVLCIALQANIFGSLVTLSSTRPGNGPSTWRTSRNLSLALSGIDGVSCPSRGLCVGVSYGRGAFSTTDPRGRPPTWRHDPIRGSHQLLSVSCPSTTFCAAGNNRGYIFTSRDPQAGKPTWRGKRIDTTAGSIDLGAVQRHSLAYLSCPSRHLCVAVDNAGNVFSSSHPTGGRRAWKEIRLKFQPTAGISCPTTSLCAIAAPGGAIVITHHPRGSAGTWKRTPIDLHSTITAVSCVSNKICFAGDSDGNIVVGRAH